MKKPILVSFWLLVGILQTMAQNISTYVFTASSGTYTALSNTTSALGTLASGTNNEGIYTSAPIGFDFFYLGERFTNIQATTNGWASLGGNVSGSVAANNFLSFSVPNSVLAPLWDDLDMTSGSFRYQTTGLAPNRIFIAEWQNAEWNWNTNSAVISFQLKLFETTGAIQFEYKQEAANVSGGSASIGIRGVSSPFGTVVFQSINGTGTSPTASTTTSTNNLNVKPATGQIYRFQCNTINAPSNFVSNGITINATTINWTDNSANETAFLIYRSTNNVNFQFIASVPSNTNSYQLTNLISGTTYFYRIFALNEGRLSTALSGSAATLAGTLGGILNVPGNYATITAALNALRTSGIANNVIIQLNTNYNSALETYPINISGIGTSASRTLTIRPAANVTNLTITATALNRAFQIENTNFVTIDGRPGGIGSTRALTITCPNGTNTILFADDCSNDTIRFCKISLNDNGQGFFPFSSVVAFTPFANGYINGSNNNGLINNEIFGINPPNCLITFQGNNQFGGITPFSTGNSFNNNLLYDFVGSNSFTNSNAAVLITGNATGFTINNNNIYQTASLSTQSFNNLFTLSGIKVNTSLPGNFTISGNFIGGGAAQCLGNSWEVGPTNEQNSVMPIDVTLFSTTSLNISNNTIRNYFVASAIGSFGSPSFAGIKVQTFAKSSNISIADNTIGADTGNSSINILNEGNVTQQVFGIFVDAPDTSSVNVSGNKIGGYKMTGTSNSDGFQFFGIGMMSSGTVQNNTIGSLTTGNNINITTAAPNSSQALYGIVNTTFPGFVFRNENISILNNTISGLRNGFTAPSSIDRLVGIEVNDPFALTIDGNTVQNLTANNPSTSETSYTLKGIVVTNLAATSAAAYNINANVIRNLFNLNSTSFGNTAGLIINNISNNKSNIGRNFIHSFNMSTTASNARMAGIILENGECQLTNNKIRLGINNLGASITSGIKITGVENNSPDLVEVWHNTVYIGGTLPSSVSNTFCINKQSNGAMNVTNNVLVNARSFTASTTTRNYCIGLASSSLYTGRNNCYFRTGNGASLGLIGSLSYDTTSTWQIATGVENSSGVVNPNLVNPTGNSNLVDLHVISPTPIEANGIPLSTVLIDFDGQVRSNFSPTDIGADAGNFTTISLPVVWRNFTVVKQNNEAVIRFSVAQQINNKQFEIERAVNGVDFTSVKTIKGDGNNNQVASFNYYDDITPFIGKVSVLYYRIKQTDFDGKTSTTIIKQINLTDMFNNASDVVIYPNPTNSVVTIKGIDVANNPTLYLYDFAGVLVKEIQLSTGQEQLSLDLSLNPTGYYFIALSNSAKRYKITKH